MLYVVATLRSTTEVITSLSFRSSPCHSLRISTSLGKFSCIYCYQTYRLRVSTALVRQWSLYQLQPWVSLSYGFIISGALTISYHIASSSHLHLTTKFFHHLLQCYNCHCFGHLAWLGKRATTYGHCSSKTLNVQLPLSQWRRMCWTYYVNMSHQDVPSAQVGAEPVENTQCTKLLWTAVHTDLQRQVLSMRPSLANNRLYTTHCTLTTAWLFPMCDASTEHTLNWLPIALPLPSHLLWTGCEDLWGLIFSPTLTEPSCQDLSPPIM